MLVKGLHDARTVAFADVSAAKQPEFTSSLSLAKTKFPVSDYSRQQQLMQSGGKMGDILQTCIPSTQSSEAPVLYTCTGPVHSLSLLSNSTQPVIGSSNTAMGIDPVISQVLLAQQLPPLPKFTGEGSDGELGVATFEDWLEHFESILVGLLRPNL